MSEPVPGTTTEAPTQASVVAPPQDPGLRRLGQAVTPSVTPRSAAVPVTLALLLGLAACGGSGNGSTTAHSATTTSRSPSKTGATATEIALGTAGTTACQSLIQSDGDVYQLLTDLETKGSASGAYKAALDMVSLASSTGMFDGQVTNPQLASALHSIVTDAPPVESAMQAQQPVSPEPLRTDLTNAASICQQHGITITWYSGS